MNNKNKLKKFLALMLAFILVLGITSIQPASIVLAATEVSVSTLADLQTAINDAGTEPTVITVTAEITTTGTVSIDGTGKNITILRGFSASNAGLFRINGGTLIFANITVDGNRSAHPNAGGPLVLVSGGTFIMNDGAVLQNNQRTGGNGGGVFVSGGTFTMNGGKIINNTGVSHGGGVAISFPNAFNMNGGEISGNSASMGSDRAGLWIDSGTTVNISGGSIINNGIFMQGGTLTFNNDYTLESLLTLSWDITVQSGTDGSYTVTRGVGGNLITYGGDRTFTLENITLDGNRDEFPAPGGSLVRMNNGTLNLGGAVVVDNNAESNVFLANNRYITLTTPLGAGSRIGVTKTDNDGIFVQSGATATDADSFFSDDSAKCIVLNSGALSLAAHTPEADDCTVCYVCDTRDLERTCDVNDPCVFHGTPMPPSSTTTWDFTTVAFDGSGTGWEWDNATKTLTLTNLTHNTTAETALRVPDGTTIVLNETNSITAMNGGGSGSVFYGIFCIGSLEIQGKGNGSLTVTTGNNNSGSSYGITCDALTISGGARVTANGANLSDASPSINSIGLGANIVNINGGELTARGGSSSNGNSFGVEGTVNFNGGIFIAEANLSGSGNKRAVNGTINTNASGYRYKMGADSSVSYVGSETPIVNNNSAYIELITARAAISFSSAVSFITNESNPQTITLNPANTDIQNTSEGWTWLHVPRILTLHGAYIYGNLTVPNGTTIILADGSHNQITGTVPTNANITGSGGNGTLNGETPPPADPSIILSRVGGPFTVGQEIAFEEVYLSYRLLNGIFADPIVLTDFHAHSVFLRDGISLGTPRRASDTEVRITFVGTPTVANTASASFNGWTTPIPAANFVGATAPVAARTVNNAFLTIPSINKGIGAAISGVPTSASVTHDSIVVNALTIPVNPSNQVVQYAINTDSGTTPSSGWQTTLTFTDLTERTVYYIHARSAENVNRFAGAVLVSEGIETPCAHADRDPDDCTQCLDCGETVEPCDFPTCIVCNPPAATIDSVTIEGTRNIEIESQTITITLENETVIAYGISNLNVNSWFANVPAGINITANADGGSDTITLTFSGTPTAVSTAPFEITIPAAYLTESIADLTVTANPNAGFEIIHPIIAGTVSIDINRTNGTLAADTSDITNVSDGFIYAWTGTGVTNADENTRTANQYQRGQTITLRVTHPERVGYLEATIMVFEVNVETSSAQSGDTATRVSAETFGVAGDTVIINYTIGELSVGVSFPSAASILAPDETTFGTPKTGERIYAINAADAGANGVITITATFTQPLTVIFNNNHDDTSGFTNANPSSMHVIPPAVNLGSLPAPPTRTGYTFAGWNELTNGLGADFTANTTVSASIIVFAQWTADEFTITLNPNGGSGGISSVNVTFGQQIPASITPPERDGFNFAGFWTVSGGTGTQYYNSAGERVFNPSWAQTNDITLYAHWIEIPPTFTVTVSSIGTGAMGSGSHAQGTTVNISAGTPPGGMQFENWSSSPTISFTDANSAGTSFVMIGEAVTVTANFSLIPATVTGVTVNPSTAEVEKGTSQQFSATVQGTNNPSQNVTWGVSGGVAGTTINSDGILTIDADETAEILTVTATSSANAAFSGTAVVTVTDAAPIITVDSVTVTPNTITLNKGDTHTFSAAVSGTNAPQGVTWSVIGGVSNITISAGALTISVNETATTLTIRATSTYNPAIYGEATVTVTQDTIIFVPVTNITGVPATATAGTHLLLTGTVAPTNATNQTIIWSVHNAGTTGAAIAGNILSTTTAGTVTVRATIVNGAAEAANYTQDFTIIVSEEAATTFTVTFNLNGGTRTGGGELLQIVISGGAATEPTVTRNGFTLNGWDTNFTNVTSNITVTAQWTANNNGNDGSGWIPPATTQPTRPAQQPSQPITPEEPVQNENVLIEIAEGGDYVVVSAELGATIAIINESSMSVTINVDLGDIGDINHHRLVAIFEDGTIIGGKYAPETGLFEFETSLIGEVTISYVEHLNRLVVQIGSNIITDLAGNAPTQLMDVVPIIENGRTLLPVRFMAYALGAEVGWNEATREVTLTLDGVSLTFPINELTPELAALGMDVPPQIIDNRTMVPLRFISEFFGAVVLWEEESRSIEIIMG